MEIFLRVGRHGWRFVVTMPMLRPRVIDRRRVAGRRLAADNPATAVVVRDCALLSAVERPDTLPPAS